VVADDNHRARCGDVRDALLIHIDLQLNLSKDYIEVLCGLIHNVLVGSVGFVTSKSPQYEFRHKTSKKALATKSKIFGVK
jgi:hypothetical protein